jgi:hypothetical protein
MSGGRIIVCARCGRSRRYKARGLCGSCTTRVYARGEQLDYVRRTRKLEDFADDFKVLNGRGLSYAQISERLGYSTAGDGGSMRHAILRAQQAGLLPKGKPQCGWTVGPHSDRYKQGMPLWPVELTFLAAAARGELHTLPYKPATVRAYQSRIRHKLGVATFAEAVRAFVAEAVLAA